MSVYISLRLASDHGAKKLQKKIREIVNRVLMPNECLHAPGKSCKKDCKKTAFLIDYMSP
jgi:hypothetical protein